MSEKIFKRTLIAFLFINVIYLLINVFVSSKAMADDLEHIHASWLVWQGQTPYTDFFEHHHPLMWYIFAPLIGLFTGNILVFFGVRFIMSLVSLGILYIVYRIVKDFLADKITALIALNIFCFSNTALNAMVQFKPDLFMHLFFFVGLYYFLLYLRDKKQVYLNIMAVSFAIAFLFLQTVLFLLLPVGLYALYFVVHKDINIRSVLKAFVLPICIVIVAGLFLYFEGNLVRYYQLNWVVNSKIMSALGDGNIVDFSDLYWILFLGVLSAIYLLFSKPNKYVILFIILWAVEFLFRTFYVSIGLYYFKMLLLYNAILLGCAIIKFYRSRHYIAWIFFVLSLVFCGKFWLFEGVGEINTLTMVGINQDISKNSSEKDMVLGTSKVPFGIFNQNPHYYWFSWTYIGKIDEELYHYAEPFDINKIISEKKPLFVYFEDDLREGYVPLTKYDIKPNLLREYYENAKYNTLYRLKSIEN